jgi:lipopolysaccharide export system protein LptA
LNRIRAAAVLSGLVLPVLAAPLMATPAHAQQLDLSHGGPIDITARDGIEWQQVQQEVIARGDAKAIRGNVTVTADRLTAWYRKKNSTEAPQATQVSGLAGDPSTEGNEIYRLRADGHVHIFTATDRAQGDKATYDLDQSVLVMTGHDLKLTTPNDVITARDDLEYWPQKHMAVARGDAVVVTTDAKRVAADTLVAYTTDNPPPASATPASASPASASPASATPTSAAPGKTAPAPSTGHAQSSSDPLAASGKLQRVEAFGNVSIRTPTDTVTGDRGVYVPDTGMARLVGNVRITRGQNELNGAEADVNMKTGIATLVAQKAGRVHGLVVPNDESNKSLGNGSATTAAGGPVAGGPVAGRPVAGSSAKAPTAPTPGSAPAGQKP